MIIISKITSKESATIIFLEYGSDYRGYLKVLVVICKAMHRKIPESFKMLNQN